MNQTIAISSFANMLSRQSGYTTEFCERFAAEMFKTVAEGLKESNEVTIKGLGTFAADSDGHVSFTPDDTFAAEVNAPFDCFEPELLDDDVTDEQLSDALNEDAKETDAEDESEAVAAAEQSAETQPIAKEKGDKSEADAEDVAENKAEAIEVETELVEVVVVKGAENSTNEITADNNSGNNNSDNKISEEEVSAEEITTDEISDNEVPADEISGNEVSVDDISISANSDDEISDKSEAEEDTEAAVERRRGIWHFVGGVAVGAVIGAMATYFIAVPQVKQGEEQMQTETEIVSAELGNSANKDIDTVTDGPNISNTGSNDGENNSSEIKNNTEDSDANIGKKDNDTDTSKDADAEVTYDTVTNTLSQLSRKHYGSYHFWVYIYDENRDIIPDPDRIEPGTRVRIPAPAKYGIDYKNKESINKALRRAQEIANEK